MASFSIRFRFVLFFHARKFAAPTNLLLSLQKDILLLLDKVIDLVEKSMLASSFILMLIEDLLLERLMRESLIHDPS